MSCRAVPAGEINAAIHTLLSMTSRSTFIREQQIEHALVHTLSGSVFTGTLHCPLQTFARHALASGVTRRGNHHHQRPTIARDADWLTLGSPAAPARPSIRNRCSRDLPAASAASERPLTSG